jgi:hypothetical protein
LAGGLGAGRPLAPRGLPDSVRPKPARRVHMNAPCPPQSCRIESGTEMEREQASRWRDRPPRRRARQRRASQDGPAQTRHNSHGPLPPPTLLSTKSIVNLATLRAYRVACSGCSPVPHGTTAPLLLSRSISAAARALSTSLHYWPTRCVPSSWRLVGGSAQTHYTRGIEREKS